MKDSPTKPPGNVEYPEDEPRVINADCPQTTIKVRNTGRHIVQIGSHYHFFETNPVLAFDRTNAYGKHLDIPPGDRVYFPPDETKTVSLVPFAGERRIRSFYNVVDGHIDDMTPAEALERLRERASEPIAAPANVNNDD